MFLLHQQYIAKEVQRLAVETPSSSTELEQSAAALMNLSVADFRAVGVVASEVEPLLNGIDAAAYEYRDKVVSHKAPFDLAVFQDFSVRKTNIKATIKQRLQQALSPDGWKQLSAYIEGPFRETVRMMRVGQ